MVKVQMFLKAADIYSLHVYIVLLALVLTAALALISL